jgi:DNA adenine methylase
MRMRYVGGKTRIATWIAEQIKLLVKDKICYLEPFVGSGATFAKHSLWFQRVIAADSHLDLVLMWQAIADGWIPPEHVSKEEYFTLKESEPSALRGLVGFGASFSGKWFGGYVDTVWDAHWNRYTKPYFAAARTSVLKLASVFKRAEIVHADYRDHAVDDTMFIYCDPPYEGTLGYGGTSTFDTATFWKTAREWHDKGALVIVSESSAPSDWKSIATRERKAMLRVAKEEANEVRHESLFIPI